MEQVAIQGARPLPPAVKSVTQQARAERAARPRPTLEPGTEPEPADLAFATSPGDHAHVVGPERKELQATRRAIEKARVDGDGFASVSGRGVISLKTSPQAVPAALSFLEALFTSAERRGWKLEATAEGTKLLVEAEPVAFRLEEQPKKTPHQPTGRELAQKKERDRWGGDSRPWPTWDLSPSGRLALLINENDYSGLRRTFSQRNGYDLVDSLEVILSGFAAHAALKIERQKERAAQAKAAAAAEARRRRLEGFSRREKHRSEFINAVATALEERAKHTAVLSHLQSTTGEADAELAALKNWLERRIQALNDRLDPRALEISARNADVRFEEPPADPQRDWYARQVELFHWIPAEEEGRVLGVGELEWAIREGLIMDPGASPDED